jgi:hypothetical protein
MKHLFLILLFNTNLVSGQILSPATLQKLSKNIIIYSLNKNITKGIDNFDNYVLKEFPYEKYLLDGNFLYFEVNVCKDCKNFDPKYVIYICENVNNSIVVNDTILKTNGHNLNFKKDNKYLIAYNKIDSSLLYLSGSFYKSIISDKVLNDEFYFENILRYKYYFYNLYDIKIAKKSKTSVLICAKSKNTENKLYFRMNTLYPDQVELYKTE